MRLLKKHVVVVVNFLLDSWIFNIYIHAIQKLKTTLFQTQRYVQRDMLFVRIILAMLEKYYCSRSVKDFVWL